MPISTVFQDEINAAEQTKKVQRERAVLEKAWVSDGGDPKAIQHVSYEGKNEQGDPVYKVRYNAQVGLPSNALSSAFMGQQPVTTFRSVPWVNTFVLREGTLLDPGEARHAQKSEEGRLPRVQDRWLNWIVNNEHMMSANEARAWTDKVTNWTGTTERLEATMQIASKNLRFGSTATVEGGDAGAGGQLVIGGGGGRGGGGGGAGPQYRAPDRRIVEDFVKGTMVSLVGTELEGDIDRITDVFMSDHRKNWDSLGQEIDPSQSVLEAVRGTADYRKVHQSRPKSADERTWVSDRRAAAAKGGLTLGQQEDFAITQATVAGDVADVAEGAAALQTQTSGSTQGTLLDTKVRGAAQALFRGVRR